MTVVCTTANTGWMLISQSPFGWCNTAYITDYTFGDYEVRSSFQNHRIHPKCRSTHIEFTAFNSHSHSSGILARGWLHVHFFLFLSQISLYHPLVFPTWTQKNWRTQYDDTSRHTVITLAHTRKCHPLPVTLSKPESWQRTPDFVPVPHIHGCFKGAARLKRACTLHFSLLSFFHPRRLANSVPLSCWNLNETGADEKNCWRGAGDIYWFDIPVFTCARSNPPLRGRALDSME